MTKKKKSIKKSNIFFAFIFLLGMGVMAYPLISRLYYRVDSTNEVKSFQKAMEGLDPEEVAKRIDLARAYNETLVSSSDAPDDPYDKKRHEEGRANYAKMLELEEKIGHVEVPKIDINIPIYAGTSEDVLQKGAGHLEGTSLPIGGRDTHTVITAHSGLPTARLFSDLKSMAVGDKFYIHNIEGTMAYQVDEIQVIEPTDLSSLLVEEGRDLATLLTCTPIMINSHRLLVRGHRVEYIPEIEEDQIQELKANFRYKVLFFASLILILILTIAIIRLRSKKRKIEKEVKGLKDKDMIKEGRHGQED